MNKLIATGLMTLTMALTVWSEPAVPAPQPTPAPIVTTASQAPAQPAQPEVKKEQAPAQPAPAKEKKPVELNFRNF